MNTREDIDDARQIKKIADLVDYFKTHKDVYPGDIKGQCRSQDKNLYEVQLHAYIPPYKETICKKYTDLYDLGVFTGAWIIESILIGLIKLTDYNIYYATGIAVKVDLASSLLLKIPALIQWHNQKYTIIEGYLKPIPVFTNYSIDYDQIASRKTVAEDFLAQVSQKQGYLPQVFDTKCPSHYERNGKLELVITHEFYDQSIHKLFHLCQYVDAAINQITSVSDYNKLLHNTGYVLILKDECNEDEIIVGDVSLSNHKKSNGWPFKVCMIDGKHETYRDSFGYFKTNYEKCFYHSAKEVSDISENKDGSLYLCQHNINALELEKVDNPDRVLSLFDAEKYILANEGTYIMETNNFIHCDKDAIGWFVDFNNLGNGDKLIDYWVCLGGHQKYQLDSCLN